MVKLINLFTIKSMTVQMRFMIVIPAWWREQLWQNSFAYKAYFQSGSY